MSLVMDESFVKKVWWDCYDIDEYCVVLFWRLRFGGGDEGEYDEWGFILKGEGRF